MKSYIEIPVRVYSAEEMDKYYSHKNKQNDPEKEPWERARDDSDGEEVEAPKGHTGMSLIQPCNIESVHEIFSIEELENNPTHPNFDVLQLVMKGGDDFIVPLTLSQFKDILSNYWESNSVLSEVVINK